MLSRQLHDFFLFIRYLIVYTINYLKTLIRYLIAFTMSCLRIFTDKKRILDTNAYIG